MRKRLSLLLIINYTLLIVLTSCSSTKQISRQATQEILSDSNLSKAHIGICIYDATGNKYLYNYQSDKFFIPASNTKIITCYAAMKHLGDSLVGLRYWETGDSLTIYPTGDPSFLHEDFTWQPVYNFLKSSTKKIYLASMENGENGLGPGWSWDDYNDDYSAERSAFPIHGNTVKFHLSGAAVKDSLQPFLPPQYSWNTSPGYFIKRIRFSNDSGRIVQMGQGAILHLNRIRLQRNLGDNTFIIHPSAKSFTDVDIPFTTGEAGLVPALLQDTLHKNIAVSTETSFLDMYPFTRVIHSQPTDSLLKIMMHRSDNFYAEQSLLMIGNEMLGVMNDAKVIDTLLKTDYIEMPQRPQWVDGSGLSRFNLFTPQDFVFVLNKMRADYDWNRITTIFETGGTGTLRNYYKNLSCKIFAKTGSLSNNIALSGYLITPKNRTLIFSVLVNNHTVSAAAVRRAVERFLTQVQAEN